MNLLQVLIEEGISRKDTNYSSQKVNMQVTPSVHISSTKSEWKTTPKKPIVEDIV